jgi:hypothetical protein
MGKSIIARTLPVCALMTAAVAPSFFFLRDSGELKTAHIRVTTIALLLTRFELLCLHALRTAICRADHQQPDIVQQGAH